ncbi:MULTISPECIES: ABC transporter ATP-binding protein [Paenibacillus]|jgi:multiple sugar transport system ATP-binding protein|uniref:Sn-glycerol-3-phosphate ABC transporter ATP-binding protein UgpC n=1 Tax=Paenibacillus baimaensis TaxID=2982185 RepID=A0ABT2UI98_9BACL|nr:sn-glycerol-3-phosphate ABC transporter ATP-binding protein UgpC [Paenibacillus sp. WQ 127069]MCU6794348.1 sn-glycerol-3-phosphate ABC transporter ATP-binding protein UgpC [Paenibacillus sp. WQ 127069]
MAEIVINHLYKRYGKDKHPVVHDFHLDIKDKEFLVFVGPSGCGKSTTLRMIAGLEDVTEGEIYIGDTLVNNLPPKDRDIAMVFQNYALYPNLSVYENIAFGLRLRKLPKHEIDLAVKKAARVLEIEQYLDRKPKNLSGGQRQRVALGRAIVRNPKVFLMDEPLSNLDAKLRVQMRTEIIKLHKTLGVTFIYVTHDQIEAMTMGDRIVVMKDGVIQQVDTPETIYRYPSNTFVASFIGSPQMNFIDGRIVENVPGKLEFSTSRFTLEIPNDLVPILVKHNQINRTLTLGIRPENINLEGLYSDAILTGVYKLSELMGADRFLHLDIGQDKLLVVRVNPGFQAKEDEKVRLSPDMTKALFFHRDTGTRFV